MDAPLLQQIRGDMEQSTQQQQQSPQRKTQSEYQTPNKWPVPLTTRSSPLLVLRRGAMVQGARQLQHQLPGRSSLFQTWQQDTEPRQRQRLLPQELSLKLGYSKFSEITAVCSALQGRPED